jgi:hypothetical protein
MSFVIKERDAFPGTDDSVNINPSNVVVMPDGTAVGNWTSEWQSEGWPETDPPEYYFTATILNGTGGSKQSSNLLSVYQLPPPQCSNIITCSDYGDQQSCQNDECTVAKNSVPSSVDCNAPNAACACSWNSTANVCEGSWRIDNPPPQTDVGTCYYTEDTTGTCQGNGSNGFLTVTWLSRWAWSPENPGQNDTQGLQAECLAANGSTDNLACPAQIPLPFFGSYNLVAALVLVALIYLVLNMKKRKTKKR